MKKIYLKFMHNIAIFSLLTLLFLGILINIYFTEINSITSQNDTLLSLKKNSFNVNLTWNITWGGGADDYKPDIAIGNDGFIYCSGSTTSFGSGSSDMALVKFSSNGTLIWSKMWGGINFEQSFGVEVDNYENIYCVGITDSFTLGLYDLVLVKYASNGTQLWNKTWGGTNYDYGYEVAVGPNGYIYCIGATRSYGAGNSDFLLVKFDSNGTIIWNTTWGGISTDEGNDLVIDSSGFIYCVGKSIGFFSISNCLALVKFAPNGTLLWNSSWDGPNDDSGYGITIDSNGYLYCSATTNSYGSGLKDFALIKFDSINGSIIWNTTFGGPSNDYNFDVVVDKFGFIYCAGQTQSFGVSNEDLMLVRFSHDGNKLWNLTWGGTGFDKAFHIVLNDLESLYLSGDTTSFGLGSRDFAILKYDFTPPDPPLLNPISPSLDTDGKIYLNWNNVSDAVNYSIYRNTNYINSVDGLSPITHTTNTNFMDTIETNGDYYYVIVAHSYYGNSSISNCEHVMVSIPTTSSSPTIPGFEFLYLILGLIAIIYTFYRKRSLFQ
ncbi:MAG: SBBP repeat-containing protein [Candidatus Helarchaeota archaeon]